MSKPKLLGGIDGCKEGWLLIYEDGAKYKHKVFTSFNEIVAFKKEELRLFVDTPIGLSSLTHKRTVEVEMRKELKGRASTVFNAPARNALYHNGYSDACNLNIAVEGKRLSKQSYHIIPKIKEVDNFVQGKIGGIEIHESHPELCFKYLNGGVVLTTNKSEKEGREERLAILNVINENAQLIYDEVDEATMKKNVRRDDIVDALCLCVSNQLACENGIHFITDPQTKTDEHGIPIRIAFGKP